jgi:hypothetical protein
MAMGRGAPMSEELDEIKLRCEAAGLDFHDEGYDVIVYFPGTAGVYIHEGTHARWVLNEPFEEYRALEGFEASWSPSQRVIECNLVQLNSATRARLGIGVGEYLASFDEDMEEMLSRLEGKDPLSKDKKRLERIQYILLRLVQDRPEYLVTLFAPKERIPIDSNAGLSISIGLSSNVHSILQEASEYPGFMESGVGRSLTLQLRGARASTEKDATNVLVKIADSVLFAIDESLDLPLGLEYDLGYGRASESKEESFPLPRVKSEYHRDAMALYWNARTASLLPTIQFLAYYQVLEYYFSHFRTHAGQRSSNGKGKMLENLIKKCVTISDLRHFIVENRERADFFYGTDQARELSRFVFSAPRTKGHDPRVTAARRINQLRNRIVHAESGYRRPLLPSNSEVKDLHHDIDLVAFLARRVLKASSQPLQG